MTNAISAPIQAVIEEFGFVKVKKSIWRSAPKPDWISICQIMVSKHLDGQAWVDVAFGFYSFEIEAITLSDKRRGCTDGAPPDGLLLLPVNMSLRDLNVDGTLAEEPDEFVTTDHDRLAFASLGKRIANRVSETYPNLVDRYCNLDGVVNNYFDRKSRGEGGINIGLDAAAALVLLGRAHEARVLVEQLIRPGSLPFAKETASNILEAAQL